MAREKHDQTNRECRYHHSLSLVVGTGDTLHCSTSRIGLYGFLHQSCLRCFACNLSEQADGLQPFTVTTDVNMTTFSPLPAAVNPKVQSWGDLRFYCGNCNCLTESSMLRAQYAGIPCIFIENSYLWRLAETSEDQHHADNKHVYLSVFSISRT